MTAVMSASPTGTVKGTLGTRYAEAMNDAIAAAGSTETERDAMAAENVSLKQHL